MSKNPYDNCPTTRMIRSEVGDAEVQHALARYRTSGQIKVHHSLPCMVMTGCGMSIGEARTLASVSYDLSDTTCEACRKACTEAPADVAKQAADMAWLREQGENFASLRELVQAVIDFEDDYDGSLRKEGRAAFVAEVLCNHSDCLGDEEKESDCGGCAGTGTWVNPNRASDRRMCFRCKGTGRAVQAQAAKKVVQTTPAGGLCHDDATKLIDRVRTSVKALRAGRAWPDDAFRSAGELESCVESIVGVRQRKETVVEALPVCASGCGASLPLGATSGGLCTACMKGAEVHREDRRR